MRLVWVLFFVFFLAACGGGSSSGGGQGNNELQADAGNPDAAGNDGINVNNDLAAGDDGAGEDGGNDEPQTSLAGGWQGTWELPGGDGSNTASMKVGQSGNKVSGSIHMLGFACFDVEKGYNEFFDGTVENARVTLVIDGPADIVIVIELQRVGENRLEGRWRGIEGDCMASGPIQFTR